MTSLPFDKARWQQDSDGVWLCLRTTAAQAAKAFCGNMEQKTYDAVLKIHREKRSLDANAYAWVLIGKLSAKLALPPDAVYRYYIPYIGDNYEIVPVREDRVSQWSQIWSAGHIGRCVDDLGPCRNVRGYRNIRCYIGSSDYDTAQMARLIDLIVQDCKDQGIETMTPQDLDGLKSRWGCLNG